MTRTYQKVSAPGGFGLLEVLIAATLLSIVAIGFSTMFSGVSRSSKVASETIHLEDSLNSVKSLFRTSELCACNLISPSPPKTFATTATASTEFEYTDLAPFSTDCSTKGAAILIQEVADNPPRKLTVTSLRVKNFFRISDTNYTADLEVKGVRSGKGHIELVRKLPLSFSTTTVGTTVTLTGCTTLAQASSGTGISESAQALRTDGSSDSGYDVAANRIITMMQGPRSAVISLNDVSSPLSDFSGGGTTALDGMKCNEADGWYIAGCWSAGSENDLFPYPNGCITNDFDQHAKHDLIIICMRIS